jgi:hypothetical protein
VHDIAASLGITERSADGIVADLAEAGYIVRQKDGRRNRYQIQAHLPLPEPTRPEPAVGEILALLAGTGPGRGRRWADAPRAVTDQARCQPQVGRPRRAPAGSAGTLNGCRPPGSAEPGQPRRRG